MQNVLRRYRWAGALLVAVLSPAPCWASTIYIDTLLDPADYQIIQYRSTPDLDITIQHLPAVPALQLLYDLPVGMGESMVGFIQPSFTYDPLTQGPVDHVDATASRYVQFLAPDFVLTSNTWRPLIRQEGNYYQAVIFITPPLQGVYQFGEGLGLHASDFGLFDFTTGILNPALNPDFSGGLMEFGFASRFNWNVTQPVTVDVRYDPLVIEVESVPVPEPATMTLVGLGMAGLALRRRRRLNDLRK